jgi:hypothetical protein
MIPLLLYPVTIDCGIAVQLFKWMVLRYDYGNRDFNIIFGFGNGKFKLTQNWAQPFNEAGTDGNPLYAFYEDCSQITDSLTSRSRVQTMVIYNHPTYLFKHPAGAEELHMLSKLMTIGALPSTQAHLEIYCQKQNLMRDSGRNITSHGIQLISKY